MRPKPRSFKLPATSLRTKFGATWIVLLILMVALTIYAGSALHSTFYSFDLVAGTSYQDIAATTHLETLVTSAVLAADDYMIHPNDAARSRFDQLSQEITAGFASTLRNVDEDQDRKVIAEAQSHWQEAMKIAGSAMSAQNQNYGQIDRQLTIQLGQTLTLLNQIYTIEHNQIQEHRQSAHAADGQLVVAVVVALGAVLFLTIVSIVGLRQYVLRPLRLLQEASEQLESGNLSHRVTLIEDDELGQVARTFNAMAEQLEKNQIALRESATHDELTGLCNRREFHSRLATEVERSRRFGRPFSLLLLDIDHFKAVNDTYGHTAGDEALQAIAQMLQGEIRTIDLATRYGGEEFTIVLPETGSSSAAEVAERIRAKIAERPLPVSGGQSIALTVSIGVAVFPDDAGSPEELTVAADAAMYGAKHRGRNQVFRHHKQGLDA